MATVSTDFATTLATIAAKGAAKGLVPAEAVEFAWQSVNMAGDAAEDDRDFVRHFDAYIIDRNERERARS